MCVEGWCPESGIHLHLVTIHRVWRLTVAVQVETTSCLGAGVWSASDTCVELDGWLEGERGWWGGGGGGVLGVLYWGCQGLQQTTHGMVSEPQSTGISLRLEGRKGVRFQRRGPWREAISSMGRCRLRCTLDTLKAQRWEFLIDVTDTASGAANVPVVHPAAVTLAQKRVQD